MDDFLEKLGKMNRQIFGNKFGNSLNSLENAVIRGEGIAPKASGLRIMKNCKSLEKEPIKSSNNRIGETGKAILMLPKQKFGKHSAYLGNYNFSETHFVDQDQLCNAEKLSQINHLTRMYGLKRIRNEASSNKKIPTKSCRFSSHDNIQVFDTKAGFLVCRKKFSLEKIYKKEFSQKDNSKDFGSRYTQIIAESKQNGNRNSVLRKYYRGKYNSIANKFKQLSSNKIE